MLYSSLRGEGEAIPNTRDCHGLRPRNDTLLNAFVLNANFKTITY